MCALVCGASGRAQETTPPAATKSPQDLQKEIEALLKAFGSKPTGSLEALSLPGGEAAEPEIIFFRAHDLVEVLRGENRHTLQYWCPTWKTEISDRLRMGPSARGVLEFPNGATFVCEGPAELLIESSPADELNVLSVLRIQRFIRLETRASPTVVHLPLGNSLEAKDGNVTLVNVDLKTLEIKNSGPEPVVVTGPYVRDRRCELHGGQMLVLPLPPIVGLGPSGPVERSEIDLGAAGKMSVEKTAEVVLETLPDGIVLTAGEVKSVSKVMGARIILRRHGSIRLIKARATRGPDKEG